MHLCKRYQLFGTHGPELIVSSGVRMAGKLDYVQYFALRLVTNTYVKAVPHGRLLWTAMQ